jgi:hypothetical protein
MSGFASYHPLLSLWFLERKNMVITNLSDRELRRGREGRLYVNRGRDSKR